MSRSRELTRPKERGKPCTCDVFDLAVACENGNLVVSLLTDLPVHTQINLNAHRLLSERNGHQWHWTCIENSMRVTLQQNSLNGFILRLTNEELDTKGLYMYRHLKGAMGVAIAAVPSTSLMVSASAPTTPHRFGICNRRLTGKAVVIRQNGHFLEQFANVEIPLSVIVMQKLGL
jgi:hypothetical protein